MAAPSVLSLIDRARSLASRGESPAPTQAAPVGSVTPSGSERRLRVVFETVPVSLCILSPESKVLAANRAALALFGIDGLRNVIGTSLDRLVVAEDRERFDQFITSVCAGEAGVLQYELAAADGTIRSLETHAVRLRPDPNAAPAFLGATWDVHARTSAHQCDNVADIQPYVAQRAAAPAILEDALRHAETMHDERASPAVEDLQAALAEAEERHRLVTAQWSDERDQWNAERAALLEKLTAAEEQHEQLSAQLLIAGSAQHSALEDAEHRFQEALDACSSVKAMLAESQQECENVTARLQDAERRNAAAAQRRQAELHDTLVPLKNLNARIEHMLSEAGGTAEGEEVSWKQ
jgi:PAS domain S-box-containing protein